MTIKQYNAARVITAMCLAAVMSQAVVLKNYYLAGSAILFAMLLLIYLKKQLKEITADERDYKIAGDAARWTLTIFSLIGALVSFALLTSRSYNPLFETAGATLSYAVCLLLVINGLTVYFLRYRQSEMSTVKKISLILLALVVIAMITIVGLRLFSGEDTWVCQKGQWVKHGNPDAPMPERLCQ